jgi:hypothetical protein
MTALRTNIGEEPQRRSEDAPWREFSRLDMRGLCATAALLAPGVRGGEDEYEEGEVATAKM